MDLIKNKLKIKPILIPERGYNIIIPKQKYLLTENRDDGTLAKEVLNKIKNLPDVNAQDLGVKSAERREKIMLDELNVDVGESYVKDIDRKEEEITKTKSKKPRLMIVEPEREYTNYNIETEQKIIQPNIVLFKDYDKIIIGDTSVQQRIPEKQIFRLNVPYYYLNNRQIFIKFINSIFDEYKDDLFDEGKSISCDDIGKDNSTLGLLTHQKIVRDYINLYTPYRGLLIYHGLGSGKTCASIAIAEGLKERKKIIVMTPASLKRNYIEEIKKCGDKLYRKNQYWEWIDITKYNSTEKQQYIEVLSNVLNLTKQYIIKNNGAWLINIKRPSNFNELSTSDKRSLNLQLDMMIQNKYNFINYNGLRKDKFRQITNNYEVNIFDNSVVIIDESHNLISRIVNKINKTAKYNKLERGYDSILPSSLALQLYEFLLRAQNCKIILLSGSPIINYPNEIAVLFNILRGYIKTWYIPVNLDKIQNKFNLLNLKEILKKEKLLDFIDYNSNTKIITITRNPYGFENKITDKKGYQGVFNNKKITMNNEGKNERIIYQQLEHTNDKKFIDRFVFLLEKNKVNVIKEQIRMKSFLALPDSLDDFISNFINVNDGSFMNSLKFKKRIIGLTSYFRSAQEELLPRYDENVDLHIVNIPMSNYQFQIYENIRQEERKGELYKQRKSRSKVIDKDGLFVEPSSTYLIFSRLYCNFVMPENIDRPRPKTQQKKKVESEIQEQEPERPIAQKAQTEKSQVYRTEENEILKEQKQLKQREKEILKEQKQLKQKEKELLKEQKQKEKELLKEQKQKEKQLLKEQKQKEKQLLKEQKQKEKQLLKEQKQKEKLLLKEQKYKKKKLRIIGGTKIIFGSDNTDDETNYDTYTDDETNYDTYTDDETNYDTYTDYDTDDDGKLDYTRNKYIDDDNEIHGGYIDNYDEITEKNIFNDINYRENEELEGDELLDKYSDINYQKEIQNIMTFLKNNKTQLLNKQKLQLYSPKFLQIINIIDDIDNVGLHLIYSQFRTMEGIGILSLALEANGYARFTIKKNALGIWDYIVKNEDIGKPTYALYTGTEEPEEKEIIRNIYNGDWDNIPNHIATILRLKSTDNKFGEIIKILMITAAGSEGINLKNTRFVHIVEPYWHPVRTEQVIGRARRICSHKSLPVQFQNVQVFIYIMVFTKEQLQSDYAIELKLKDVSRYNSKNTPQTTDEKLFEICNIKAQLNNQILKNVKETSIDCAIHRKSSTKEGLTCIQFGNVSNETFTYKPNIDDDENDRNILQNKQTIEWNARKIQFPDGRIFAYREDTKQLYDYESYLLAKNNPDINPLLIGKLINIQGKYFIQTNEN